MRKRELIFVMAFGLVAAGCASRVWVEPVVSPENVPRLAVLPFETDSFLSTVGHQLADEIVAQLLKQAPDFEVVERSRIDALVQEQELARGGYVSRETAVTLGRLLGVSAILTGSVSLSVGDVQPTPLSAQRVASGSVSVRLIDVQTGRILWGDRLESQNAQFLGREDEGGTYQVRTDHEMVQDVIRELSRDVARAFTPHYEIRY